MSRSSRTGAALAGVAAIWMVGLLAPGVGDALIYLTPALLILLPLLVGRYPGGETLTRATARGRSRRPRATAALPRRRVAAIRLLPRGGRLVGASMAGRGPPVAAACPIWRTTPQENT